MVTVKLFWWKTDGVFGVLTEIVKLSLFSGMSSSHS